MLILVAHGSRDPRWRASVEEMVRALQREAGPDGVALAYMDCAPPSLLDVASRLARRGVGRVRVLPLFLTTEGHVDRDVRPMVEEVRRACRGLEVELLPPMGHQPEFRRALARIVGSDPAGRLPCRQRRQAEARTS